MTPEEAVQAVCDVLNAAQLDRGDDNPLTVTDHMPLDFDRPCAVAVEFAGMTETEWLLTVTLISDTSSDVEQAEKLTRTLAPAVDAALNGCPAPRSGWSKAWSIENNAYMTSTILEYPRDDF